MLIKSISNAKEATEGVRPNTFASTRNSTTRMFMFGATNGAPFPAFKYVENNSKVRTAYVLCAYPRSDGLQYVVTTSDDPTKPRLFAISATDVCCNTDEFIRWPADDQGKPINMPAGVIVGDRVDEKKLAESFSPPAGEEALFIARAPIVFPLLHQHSTANGSLFDVNVGSSIIGYDRIGEIWWLVAKYQAENSDQSNFGYRYDEIEKSWIPGPTIDTA